MAQTQEKERFRAKKNYRNLKKKKEFVLICRFKLFIVCLSLVRWIFEKDPKTKQKDIIFGNFCQSLR